MKMKKLLYISLGFICLMLGAVGVVMPLLPTTPLVLLAAICFSRGSKRLDNWLSRSRLFGPFIVNYRTGLGISKCRKIASIVFLWVGLITSMAVLRTTTIYIILCIVGVGVTIHLLMIKTKKQVIIETNVQATTRTSQLKSK